MARYRDFMDMIDGGGAGRMGGEFEGGGLLSVLANAFATPYGSEDAPSGDLRQRSPNKQRTQPNEFDLFVRFDSDSSTQTHSNLSLRFLPQVTVGVHAFFHSSSNRRNDEKAGSSRFVEGYPKSPRP